MASHNDVSRREAIGLLALFPITTASSWSPSSLTRGARTFVLVHGAWHGGWCWKKVARLLRSAGHDVYTPTLTGLGERSHLLSRAVSLDTHLDDIALLLEYEDLAEVTLVGHSYGGMVIAGVAERATARIERMIFLDAFLPENGKALRDYAPIPPLADDGWRIPVPASASEFGVTDPGDIAWVQQRLGDQPVDTFTQAVTWNHESDRFARAYIRCTNAPWFVDAAERAAQLGYTMHSIADAGHDVMITVPDELADLLSA